MRIVMLVMLLTVASLTKAEDSVVIGKGISNKYTGVKLNCSPDICDDVWIRFKIKVQRTLSGPALTGYIYAVRIQHTEYTTVSGRYVFVVRKIDDPAERELFKADYFLK